MLNFLGRTSVGPVIQHMWDQEKEHKAKFEELIPKHRVRPTVLIPVWNVAGFLLGAGEEDFANYNFFLLKNYQFLFSLPIWTLYFFPLRLL